MAESRVLGAKMNTPNQIPDAQKEKQGEHESSKPDAGVPAGGGGPLSSNSTSIDEKGDKENIDVLSMGTEQNGVDQDMVADPKTNVAKGPKEPIKRKKISDFITDKSLRVRSYVRRRPIPLRRVSEIDVQCGTKSFLLQICHDFEEAVYCGHSDLVKCFLNESGGLKIADVNRILIAGKYQARPKGTSHNWEHDYNPAPASDDGDDDYNDASLEKETSANTDDSPGKSSIEAEYIKNPVERLKRFKAFKDSLLSKVKEIDNICGVLTFVVIVNMERDTAFYCGPDSLVSEFFTTGLRRAEILKQMNVRQYEVDEGDMNICCVPQCAVTRNTLSKWRNAAIQHFRFPKELAFNLHLCAPEDRDRWIAEIDLDPAFKTRVAVCSLHFVDGYPTPENPHPTQLLTESSSQQFFQGKLPERGGLSPSEAAFQFCQSLLENFVLRSVNKEIDTIEERRAREEKLVKERLEKRRKDLLVLKSIRFHKFAPIGKLKKRSLKRLGPGRSWPRSANRIGKAANKPLTRRRRSSFSLARRGQLDCRFCSSKFVYTKALFQHVRNVHVAPVRRREVKELVISNVERRRVMSRLFPPPKSRVLDPKKKYVCAVCKSVCDLVGLFIHMKEVHQGLLCQYCLKLFKKVRDLQHHLSATHGEQPRYYHNMDQFKKYSGTSYTLACGECSAVMSVNEAERHVCGTRITLECPWCRQVMLTQEEVEGHIVNGCCQVLKLYDETPSFRDIQVVYKILTGKVLEMPEEEEDTNPADMMDTEINAMLEVDIGGTKPNIIKVKENPVTPKAIFTCFNKAPINSTTSSKVSKPIYKAKLLIEDMPLTGTIYSGFKSKGITNNIKKEFKDKGRAFDINKEVMKSKNIVALEESVKVLAIQKAGRNFIIELPGKSKVAWAESEEEKVSTPSRLSKRIARQPVEPTSSAPKPPKPATPVIAERPVVAKEKVRPESRQERIIRLGVEIKENLKRMRRVIDMYPNCLFCQQCKTVSVDAQFLLSHLHIIHSEESLTNYLGEDAQHCISRIKRYLRDKKEKEILFNYIAPEEIFVLEFYRCSYCPTTECQTYEDLFKHTALAHSTKVLTCNICDNIFLNYGSLISHVCSGPPTSSTARARFACKVCHRSDLSSFLEFQTHIRREHNTCEICFEAERDQASLHTHCATHDQDLMCMKCFVTFEKVESFRKHMFWKHSQEQADCKVCHSPTWPHVYHFCLPNLPVPCHTCDQILPNAASFKVHNRQHLGSTPHACSVPKCDKSFISKSLLWKHQIRRHPQLKESVGQLLYKRKLQKDAVRFGTTNTEALDVAYKVIDDLWESLCLEITRRSPEVITETPEKPEKPPEKKESVLDAAIRSIMPEAEQQSPATPGHAFDARAISSSDRDAIQATIAERSYSEDNSWQAGLDALLIGASVKLPKLPTPSDQPPDQLFQSNDVGRSRDSSSSSSASSSSSEDEANTDKGPPVIGGLWNQDLCFIGSNTGQTGAQPPGSADRAKISPYRSAQGGPRVRGMGFRSKARPGVGRSVGHSSSSNPSGAKSRFDLNLSESSDDEGGQTAKPAAPVQLRSRSRRPLLDHDYCYAAYMMSKEPVMDTNEMDKIVSNVAFDGFGEGYDQSFVPPQAVQDNKRKKKKKDKKRKKKKKRKKNGPSTSGCSGSSDVDELRTTDVFGIKARNTPVIKPSATNLGKVKALELPTATPVMKRGPKPKYHTPDVAKTAGVTAGVARPSFDTDSSSHAESDNDPAYAEEEEDSDDEVRSSDLDTDFSADEREAANKGSRETPQRASTKTAAKPTLKLKIKLPAQKKPPKKAARNTAKQTKSKKRRRSSYDHSQDEKDARPLSKKMRESLALNQRPASSEEDLNEDSLNDDDDLYGGDNAADGGSSKTADNLKLYCYCQCPHDDISEMIGCDAPDCRLEWFHFECVGIMVPPDGKWYCPECTKRYGLE